MDVFTKIFNQTPVNKIGFDDIIHAIKNPDFFYIINTLSAESQDCLIKNTVPYQNEEKIVNDMISAYAFNTKKIIIYGKNSQDDSAEVKYRQLRTLGFEHIYIYSGGLFEWMLLQDIYGQDAFPTNRKVLDILRYKASSQFL